MISLSMRTILKILSLSLLLMISACGQRASQERDVQLFRAFPKAMPPAMMQDREEMSEWMSLHFWDAYLSDAGKYACDSSHVAGVTASELDQQMANYMYVLDMVPLDVARKAVAGFSSKVEATEISDTSCTVFEAFRQLCEKYMYDPNSPLRNEDVFQPFAQMLSTSRFLTEAERERFAYISRKCNLNRVGTKAADFRFCDRRGREYTLYGIKADYTLLFFSNPGCNSCMEIINGLKSMPKVSDMIRTGRMAVLNIYIDEDIQNWRDYMPVYPEEWYNGFDPDFVLRNNEIYNVRAIPSLYLLDAQKTVVMKDAVPDRLFNLIEKL